MGRTRSLDGLLGEHEKVATFHDAFLLSVHVDYVQRRWIAEFDICVGDPDSSEEAERECRRHGRLTIDGLKVWVLEARGSVPTANRHGLWLTDDGPLRQSPTETGKTLALAIDADAVGWWMFFSDLNTFSYVAGHAATFNWRSS